MPKVCIDAGHGGSDPGAVSTSRREKDDNLLYAYELQKQFAAQGWAVVMTRTEDNNLPLATRTAIANSNKCDIVLSCHRNSYSNPAANGAEIWLHSQAPQRYKDWAADNLSCFEEIGFTNRGVKLGHASGSGEYAINRDTIMPSMLIEAGFVTNDKDNALFDTAMSEICDAIVRGCCTFLGVEYKEPAPAVKTYTLDIGKLKEQGFSKIEITL